MQALPVVDKKALGRRLRQARLRADLVSYRLASQATGIPVSTLKCYERGRSVPGGENLERLAQAYGVTTAYLMGVDNNTAALKAGMVLVDQQLIDAILATRDASVIGRLLQREPSIVLCMVEIPDAAALMEPRDARRLHGRLVEHLQRYAPNVLRAWHEKHG